MRALVKSGLELGAIICGFASPDTVGRVMSALELAAVALGALPEPEVRLGRIVQRAEASLTSAAAHEFSRLGEADQESIAQVLRARIDDSDAAELLVAAFTGEEAFSAAFQDPERFPDTADLTDDEQGYLRALVGVVHSSVEALSLSGDHLGPVVQAAFKDLRSHQLSAQDVRTMVTQEFANRNSIASHVVVGDRPRPARGFVRRDASDELKVRLDDGHEKLHVLSGLRGTGKSQIAAAVSADCVAAGWSFVAWVNASSPESIRAELRAISVLLGLVTASDDEDVALAAMRVWINDGSAADRLLVFDDVENLRDVEKWLPLEAGPHIVVTTVLAEADPAHTVNVGVLPLPEAIDYLLGATRSQDRAGAQAVAEALGCLPLALAQASSTMQQSGFDFDRYLAALESRLLVDVLEPETTGYTRSVWAALSMSIDSALDGLRRNPARASAGQRVLSVLSLSPERGVPREWLSASGEDEFETSLATGALITSSVLGARVGGSDVTMHRLIARVVRERMSTAGTADDAVGASIAQITRQVRTSLARPDRADRAAARRIILHLTDVAREPELHTLARDPRFLELASGVSVAAQRIREPAAVATMAPFMHLLETEFGRSNMRYVRLAESVANAQSVLGDFDDAIRTFEELLQQTLADHGPASEMGVKHLIMLAHALGDSGDGEGARRLYDEALLVADQLPGGATPLKRAASSARAMLMSDDDADVLTGMEAALNEAHAELGPNAERTLILRNNLAETCLRTGDTDRAVRLLDTNLRVRRAKHGDAHPATVVTISNLVNAMVEDGRPDEARLLGDKAYEDAKTELGEDHTDLLTLRHNMSRARTAAGDHIGAARMLRQLVEARSRVLGATHPDTLASRHNLVNTYLTVGNTKRAERELPDLLADTKARFGPDHNEARNVQELAQMLAASGGDARHLDSFDA